jgi:hypothetical protein
LLLLNELLYKNTLRLRKKFAPMDHESMNTIFALKPLLETMLMDSSSTLKQMVLISVYYTRFTPEQNS